MTRMMTRTTFLLLFGLIGAVPGGAARAADDAERAGLARQVNQAKITLEDGLRTSERTGRPISAKFEVEGGKFQFSAYTIAGDGLREVVANPVDGAVEKTDPITDAEDLGAAAQQRAAMEKASLSLITAAERAAKANPGYRVVSIYPALKDGHPVAEVTLLRGEDYRTVAERLD